MGFLSAADLGDHPRRFRSIPHAKCVKAGRSKVETIIGGAAPGTHHGKTTGIANYDVQGGLEWWRRK